jgi:hypothetical protein
MAEQSEREQPPAKKDRDERVSIPLDPEEALRGLLEVDPESEPAPPKPHAASDR